MTDEPADTPDTESWGGQDGFEVQSEGMENEWYKGGAQEVYSNLDATYVMGEALEVVAGAVTNFVAGAEVSAVAGLSLDLALAPKIEWQPIPFAVELHGLHMVGYSLGHTEKSYDFSATSVGSHAQTVEGELTWQVTGSEEWAIDGDSEVIVAGKATWSSTGNMSLESSQMSISGLTATKISGATSAQLGCGPNSVQVTPAKAALMCGTAGITATATNTVLSGARVEIGVPGAANPAIATQPAVTAAARLAMNANAEATLAQTRINQLEAELNKLKTQYVSKASQAAKFAAAIRVP